MIKTLLKLIPVRTLVKYLPDVLAYLLTKGLGYVLVRYPHKSAKIIETAEEISKAMLNSVVIAKTGVIAKEDIEKQRKLWKAVFE